LNYFQVLRLYSSLEFWELVGCDLMPIGTLCTVWTSSIVTPNEVIVPMISQATRV